MPIMRITPFCLPNEARQLTNDLILIGWRLIIRTFQQSIWPKKGLPRVKLRLERRNLGQSTQTFHPGFTMSDRIKDYKLIQRYQVEDLENDVKEHIRAGYELLGAPHLTTDQEKILYTQPMILRGNF
tara:strand:+ start:128 stop:508 length:381 start_codon:yes stop_codon:yes gene_type:complete